MSKLQHMFKTFHTLTACLGVILTAPVLASAVDTASPGATSNRKHPNIVLIISDDHAWTDYGFMGHPHIRTPNLDQLASQSLTFRRGYVPSSLCCPSLASIITGLYPHQHRITSNDPPMPPGKSGSKFYQSSDYKAGREVMNRHLDAAPTLPRMLADAGYDSLQTGKWWQGDYKRGGFTHGMTRGDRHGDDGIDIGRRTMQPIYDFIAEARQQDRPFFVWYAPMMPHQAHNPPPRFLKHYKDVAPTIPVAKYWGMVEWFDDTVGQLLSHLDDQKLADDTIVLYVTDNGWITDPQTGQYAPKSKQSQYDGGLRTPILIRWPGQVKPERSESLAMSIDIMPTLLAAAGLKPTPQMQGISLLDEKARDARKAIFGECFLHESKNVDDPSASLRWRWTIEGDWKLIVPNLAIERNSEIELYDLTNDPHEEQNLARENDAKVAVMNKKLDAWWAGEKRARDNE
jgi:arylsulfatase A-like enzyme